jgi:hypothetical protein
MVIDEQNCPPVIFVVEPNCDFSKKLIKGVDAVKNMRYTGWQSIARLSFRHSVMAIFYN